MRLRYTGRMGTHKHWGFDTAGMDKSVRPQDDFFRYANGGWLKSNEIPPQESRWGSFNILRRTTEDELHALLKELSSKRAKAGTPAQLAGDLFRSGMDQKKRDKLGTAPLLPYLKKIEAITNTGSAVKVIGELHALGVDALWGSMVDQDSKNSAKNVLHFYQSGLGMPDRDYYLKTEPEFLRVRTAYQNFVKEMFVHLGRSSADVARAVEVVMSIETNLATLSMTKVDARDAEKTYHKQSPAQFRSGTKGFDWTSYFRAAGIPAVPYIIVMQPKFMEGAARLVSKLSIADLQTYLTWHLLADFAPYLSEPIIKTYFEFYGRTLIGAKEMKPLWRRVLMSVNGTVGFALGRAYIDKHFTREARRKMDLLVDDLFAAYEKRMKALDWMSPVTKKKAIHKLRAVSRKIGYPTKWKSYKGLTIRPDDFAGNIIRSTYFEHKRNLAKLKKPIDRTEWHMTPQTVNAYCNFNLNEIVFPAAILQHPFFSPTADDAVNYGAIGSVIGHELTHAFDDQGAKFDARGNMKRWWQPADRKRFDAKAAVLVKQFNGFSVEKGVPVNGKLTLGENIADLGGAVIAYDAYQERLKKTGRKDIDGYTPEQRFFLGFAQQERELTRPEYLKMMTINDPHSPAEFRINGPLVHMDEFYTTFGIKKGDKLYRDPKDRAKIW